MTTSFLSLTVYIEFQKLLGIDDQNNVKHLHSVLKKKKERKSVIWRIQIVRFNMSSRIKMLVRVDHRICNFLKAEGVFNHFFGYGFSFIYNLGVCKSESTVRDQEPFSRKKSTNVGNLKQVIWMFLCNLFPTSVINI